MNICIYTYVNILHALKFDLSNLGNFILFLKLRKFAVCVYQNRLTKVSVPKSLEFMDILHLYGRRNFTIVIKVMDLNIERLFWIISLSPV